jgi:hypothetical protein
LRFGRAAAEKLAFLFLGWGTGPFGNAHVHIGFGYALGNRVETSMICESSGQPP